MSEPPILRDEVEPGIVRLTFNRPDKLNALSTPVMRALEAEVDRLAREASTRVVILTGAGERAFV
ncbi:MAG: enoyl-CoA hydratase/isomerase family protein, partial [Hyphomicrobiales bacterium]|nr:enoyl-CoA hydratase/isomerase family protein [Hyphomicrobiales bacterium]